MKSKRIYKKIDYVRVPSGLPQLKNRSYGESSYTKSKWSGLPINSKTEKSYTKKKKKKKKNIYGQV